VTLIAAAEFVRPSLAHIKEWPSEEGRAMDYPAILTGRQSLPLNGVSLLLLELLPEYLYLFGLCGYPQLSMESERCQLRLDGYSTVNASGMLKGMFGQPLPCPEPYRTHHGTFWLKRTYVSTEA